MFYVFMASSSIKVRCASVALFTLISSDWPFPMTLMTRLRMDSSIHSVARVPYIFLLFLVSSKSLATLEAPLWGGLYPEFHLNIFLCLEHFCEIYL